MRAFVVTLAVLCGSALAAPQAATAGGATCFDAGDCLLAGGGDCQKPAGQLLGTCNKSASAGGAGAAAPSSQGAAANPLGALLGGAGAGAGAAQPGTTTQGAASGQQTDLLNGFQPVPPGIL